MGMLVLVAIEGEGTRTIIIIPRFNVSCRGPVELWGRGGFGKHLTNNITSVCSARSEVLSRCWESGGLVVRFTSSVWSLEA